MHPSNGNKVLHRTNSSALQKQPLTESYSDNNNNNSPIPQLLANNLNQQDSCAEDNLNDTTTTTTTMAAAYHKGNNDEGRYSETARLGPIAETIINTLSQDNLFMFCLVMVEILGIVLIGLCIGWMGHLGGFGFDKSVVFNFHPPLMTFGMIFLNANGILIYRSTQSFGYKTQKLIHFGLQTSAIVISWIGFIAAYVSHVKLNIAHFYSLHSWLGFAALVGVTISLVTSYITFLYPKASPVYRRLTLPFHVFGGIANIALSAAVCIAGITEKAIFSLNKNPEPKDTYAGLPSVAMLLNMFGCIMAIFTMLVVWMVTKPEFKRKNKLTINTPHYVLRREKTLD